MKLCNKCNTEKKQYEFISLTGKATKICRDCLDYFRERRRKYKERNPERYSRQNRDANLRKKYGISLEKYEEILESQDGVCLSCGEPENSLNSSGGLKNLAVDHCHTTGEIRGLLCATCNVMVGMAYDDPKKLRAAANYLENYKEI